MNTYPIKAARIAGAQARDTYTAAAARHLRAIVNNTAEAGATIDDHRRALDLLDSAHLSEDARSIDNALDAAGWPIIRWSLEP